MGLIGSVKCEVKQVKNVNVVTWQVTNLLRLLEAKSLVLGPVAVIMMTGPSGKRVAVIAACASPLIHWPFEVASVTIELFENFMLKGLLAC